MATSTFGKQFIVKSEKAEEFVKEMKKAVAPTLQKDFYSNSVHLAQEESLRQKLARALGYND